MGTHVITFEKLSMGLLSGRCSIDDSFFMGQVLRYPLEIQRKNKIPSLPSSSLQYSWEDRHTCE